MLSILAIFAARCLLIILFLPFSALDEILNYETAVDQAAQTLSARSAATTVIFAGFIVGSHTLHAIILNPRGAGWP